jgi:large subunit ribosomal protein L4
MASITVYDKQKNKVSDLEVSDAVFNADVKEYLIHEAVKVQLANRRAGTVAVKNRSAVSGSGKKPFRQKGTGGARQGCKRAPHYPGGGVAFGPQPKEYDLAMNKKTRKAAMRSALSLLFKENKLTVVDSLAFEAISTKSFVSVLNAFDISKTLVVTGDRCNNLELSARNVKNVKVLGPQGLTVYDMLKYKNIIFTQDAVKVVEGVLQP